MAIPSLRDLAVVDLRSIVLLAVPCRKLLVNQGSVDVSMPLWSTLHQLLDLIWDVNCEEGALCARDEEALAVDLLECRPFVFFWYVCYPFLSPTFLS